MSVKKFSTYSNQAVADDAAKMLWENPAATNSYHQTLLQLKTQLAGGFTLGSVLFANALGFLDEDNTNLFWDNINKRLGIGTTSPQEALDVNGNILAGQSGVDEVLALTDNSDTITVYLNTGGISYFNGGYLGVGITTPGTNFVVNGGQGIKRTSSAVNYNPSALTEDYLIAITDTASPRTVIISDEDIQSGTPANPRIFIIKDESGGAGTNNITVSGESGTIDGAANFPIATNHGSITIYADGTNLWIY